jgi:hypothetical protein
MEQSFRTLPILKPLLDQGIIDIGLNLQPFQMLSHMKQSVLSLFLSSLDIRNVLRLQI